MNIIINADDFGMRPGIDNAIIELVEKGLLTSVSLLITHPNKDFAIDYINKHPELGAGIHLDLDSFFTRAGFGTNHLGRFLVPDVFFENEDLIKDLKTEIVSQLDIFCSSGRIPDHVDGHHSVHLFLPILRILLPEMKKRNIPAIRFDNAFYQVTSDTVIAIDLLHEYGIVYPEKFVHGPVLPEKNGALSAELMVHVSQDVPEEECWRIKERSMLLNPHFSNRLKDDAYSLISFSDIQS